GGAAGQRACGGVPSGDRRRDAHPQVGDGMRDERVESLAKILVQYSTKVEKGETCMIGGVASAEPLLLAIYEEVLRAGGNPIVQMAPEEAAASFYRLASDEQLDWIPPTTDWIYNHADVVIRGISDDNT